MGTTFSTDGTKIVYEITGQGPALIIVAGALQDRSQSILRSTTTTAVDVEKVAILSRTRLSAK